MAAEERIGGTGTVNGSEGQTTRHSVSPTPSLPGFSTPHLTHPPTHSSPLPVCVAAAVSPWESEKKQPGTIDPITIRGLRGEREAPTGGGGMRRR